MSGFSFGDRSLRNLAQVHPDLVKVLTLAIKSTPVDIGVLDMGGFRSEEQQQALFQRGRDGHPGPIVTQKDGSAGHESNHQAHADGFGHAVDVVPFMHGSPTWNWEYIFRVIPVVGAAARSLCVSLRWGGVWDRLLEELDLEDLPGEMLAYQKRHAGPDLLDGPHVEYMGKIKKEVKK